MNTQEQMINLGYTNKSATTWRVYLGIKNQETLEGMGYENDEWITFLQIQRLNWRLQKGAKGALIYYRATEELVDEETGAVTKNEVYRPFTVFNMDEVIRPESDS